MKFVKHILLALSLISFAWAANALKITSSAQLLAGDRAIGIVGDYLLKNDSVSFVISDITHLTSQNKYGGNVIDATFQSGLDDFDLMYLYLNESYPRQGKYNAISIISSGAPYDSAHIQVRGVDSDNSSISITTDYILYDTTPILKVISSFENQSATTINNYGLGDAFAWGSAPFVPGSNSSSGWLASKTLNTLYGYIAKENFSATHGSYWSDATLEEAMLSTGVPKAFTRYFMVANSLKDIYNTYLDIQNLPSGSLSVSVTHDELPVSDATVSIYQGSYSGPILEGETNNFGYFNTDMQTGNWICKVSTGGQTKEQSFSIITDASHELSFSMDTVTPPVFKQDTLTIIQFPLINIPTMALPGDTFKVEIDLPESEFAESLSLLFNGNQIDLNYIESDISSPFGLRTLEATLPNEMFYGLYDLKITCSGEDSLDISEHALYVIPEYKNDFSFIHVTDTHLPSHFFWGDEGLEVDSTELLDFAAVIDDINIINPDFVLHTGDFINDGEIEVLGIPSISRSKKLLHELEVPFFLVAGNHDLGGWDDAPAPDGTARRYWWKYFGWKYLSSTSTSATTSQNYSFNYGQTHFIGLEAYNNYDRWRETVYGTDSFTAPQLQWLNNDLAQHVNDDLTIAFYHKDFQSQLNLSSLGIDAAFYGHHHSNDGAMSYTPYNIRTGATCDGGRWYRLVTVSNNVITSMETFQAGNNGQLITKTVSLDKLSVTFTNNSDATFHDCLVTFPLEEGKQVDSISNAILMQIDTLSTPKIVYANLDLPANSSVTTTMTVEDAPLTAINSIPESIFLTSVYPNPFNPILIIKAQLAMDMNVDVNIFDLQGKRVYSCSSLNMNKGINTVKWNAGDQASGLYFIYMTASNSIESFQTVNKCLLLK